MNPIEKLKSSYNKNYNKHEIKIIHLTRVDAEYLTNLYCQEENIIPTKELVSRTEAALKRTIEREDVVLGAYLNNELVGALTVHFIPDTYIGFTETPYVHIETMIVNKNYQDMGVGTSLVKEAIKLSESINATYLIAQTDSENKAACKVFEKAGLVNKYNNFYKSW